MTSPARGLRHLFLGPHGLRAGWRALGFLLLAGALQLPVVFALIALGVHQAQLGGASDTARGVAVGVSFGLFGVLAATLLAMRLERRPAAAYGLGLRGAPGRFAQGALVGLALMGLLTGLLLLTGGLAFDGVSLRGAEAWRSGLAWAGACLMVALLEELITRGYLLQVLARSLGFRWAVVLTALLFAAGHLKNAGESPIGLAAVVLIGLVWGYSVWRLGSLWWALGFHAAWNWAQSFLFGVGNSGFDSQGHLLAMHPTGPDWLSGGATGPEGSLLNLGIIGLAGLAVHLTRRAAPPPTAASPSPG